MSNASVFKSNILSESDDFVRTFADNNISKVNTDVIAYKKERQLLLKAEANQMLGSDIIFSDTEEKVNNKVMELKQKSFRDVIENPRSFILLKHFFKYKNVVKESELFKLIKLMPKGAVLHAHDTGLLSPDYVLQLTYMPNLYVSFSSSGIPQFRFSNTLPDLPSETQWQLMSDVRNSSKDIKKFDEELRRHFTIVVDKPHTAYPDINTVWSKFQNYFISSSGLFTYKPVWKQYFYDALKAFRDDNVMYIEIRSVLPALYDLEGCTFDSVDTAVVYKEVSDHFCKDYPDFFGAKLIYAPMRRVNTQDLNEYLKIAREIKKRVPGFLVGFDLVGQEDFGPPLADFVPVLSEAADEFNYFFHAGETNWYGTSIDENLVDAILLGTKRIGHAFALVKHPVLLEEVKRRDIAIEANIISNAVLKLVTDIRNHPVATLIAQNVPMVISSDDPGVWEAEPLSHDFYVTFMGVASHHADLRLLKKLALNSLNYSAYPDKVTLLKEFEVRWKRYIDTLIQD